MKQIRALTERAPGYPIVNLLTTALAFLLPATLGSGISVFYHVCAAWCILEALFRSGFSRDRPMWAASACLTVFAGISFTAFWTNGVGTDTDALIPLLTLGTLPFTYSVLTFARKADIATAAVLGSMAAAYGAGILAVAQFYGAGQRAEGLAGNPLVFGHVASLAGAVCLIGLVLGFTEVRGRAFGGFLAGGLAAATLAVLLSQSRSYWLVFLLQSAAILAMGWFGRGRRLSGRARLVGAACGVTLAVLAYQPVRARFHALSRDLARLGADNYDTSLGLRIRLIELGLRYVREHPWIGYGVPSSKPLVHTGLAKQFALGRSFSHFHNGFVTATVETGLIGLAMLFCLFAVIGIAAWRGLRDAAEPAERFGALMLVALLVSLIVGGSVNIVIGHDILDATLMAWLMVGLFLATGTVRSAPASTAGTAGDEARGES